MGTRLDETRNPARTHSTTLLEVPLMVFLGAVERHGLGDLCSDGTRQVPGQLNLVDGAKGSEVLRLVVVEDH